MREWFVFGPEVDEDRLTQLSEAAFEFVAGLLGE